MKLQAPIPHVLTTLAGALALALLTLPQATQAEPSDGAAFSPKTQALFKKHCKKCHGMDGRGDTAMGKRNKVRDLTTAAYQGKATDADVLKSMTDGFVDPDNPKRKMPSYQEELSEAERQQLLKVVRAFAKSPGPFPE